MKYLLIPIEDLKEIDNNWKYRRKYNTSNGLCGALHIEIYDRLIPNLSDLNFDNYDNVYPYDIIEK